MFCVKAHRKETQRENTDRKHREKTLRRNTERKHTQKTQTVQTFLWWCFCGGVVGWCFCGGVVLFWSLWWCFCGGVFVFLWRCFCVVFLWRCSCGGVFVVVFLWCKTQEEYADRSFQNERFARCFRQFSQKKLPKWSFRARLPTIFTERASKMIVSCEASATFQGTSFQNEHFVRGFLQITELASKTSVSRDASDNFHRRSFQKDSFVRGFFFQISQKKLPKRAFRAMHPTIFTEKASKMIISCEASSKFHRTVLPKRTFRAMLPTIFTKNLRFATVSRDRHTDSCERVHPPKAKCASHYSAVHSQTWQCAFRHSAVRKIVWIYRPWTDRPRANENVRFYYSFGRSTPRF